MMEEKNTNLSITKEQAEAFAKWKQKYTEKISFAIVVLREELGVEKYEESKLYMVMKNMKREVNALEITKGSAEIGGKKIVSDIEFGFVLTNYIDTIKEVFWAEYNDSDGVLPYSLFESMGELHKIFLNANLATYYGYI